MSEEEVRAAGGVLHRRSADGTEVALVHRPRYDDWSLPKGKLAPGEEVIVGACREVIEETGAEPAVGPRLPSITYPVQTKSGPATKVVHYWSMTAIGQHAPFTPNDEVDAVEWLPVGQARSRLSHDHDRTVLDAFAALDEVTAGILVIRHGRAGDRNRWHGDDALRPLDELGLAQAARIARVLPWYRPVRVLSADRLRCVQTVEPLAKTLGLQIELDQVFSEEAHRREPERAPKRIRELAGAGGVTAISSQREVIPDTVRGLAEEDGLRLEDVESRKGSVWALFFQGTRLIAADYMPDLES